MFRETGSQRPLFSVGALMGPERRERCEQSWAGAFRRGALPILLEHECDFADLFDPSNGSPNRSVALVVGALILKDMFDLTDEETWQHLCFDLRWMYAFEAVPQEENAYLCVKTLYNFRQRLMGKEKSQEVFGGITDTLIEKLGLNTDRQRLDSTHVVSNIAILGRLGLFCETIRVFLAQYQKEHPRLYETHVSEGIRRRYMGEKEYGDARKGEGKRRLAVAARDVYRLVTMGRERPETKGMFSFGVLERLMEEQCRKVAEAREPKDDDDDHGEGAVPVTLQSPGEVESRSLQSPHDPNVTYSGHKGKGYEVQVAETCGSEDPVRLITAVAVTRSCDADQQATIPMLQELQERGIKPEELITDTNYGGGKNAAEASEMGTNLLCPAPPSSKPKEGVSYEAPQERCPTEAKAATEWLTKREAQGDFYKRYAIRAGIEGTNSELKRGHGMGKLRVRGGDRVALSAYLKTAACNVKRALKYWSSQLRQAVTPPGRVPTSVGAGAAP